MILTAPCLSASRSYTASSTSFLRLPHHFGEIRGFNDGITGITFVSIMLGILGALALVPVEKLYKKETRNGTYPEARLSPMMAGLFIVPMTLFIFAFTGAYRHVRWMGPVV